MERVKIFFGYFRDALCYVFSWLMICALLICLATGRDSLSVGFVLKLLVFCAWTSAAFVTSFMSAFMKKRGFILQLSLFYVLFVPAEIFFFYNLGIFADYGTPVSWAVFFAIIALLYVLTLCIDVIIMKKRAVRYTEKLMEYKNNL